MARLDMNSSALMRHDPDNAGNTDHWFPSARRAERSYRIPPVRQYGCLKPYFARRNEAASWPCSMEEIGAGESACVPAPRLSQRNKSVMKPRMMTSNPVFSNCEYS